MNSNSFMPVSNDSTSMQNENDPLFTDGNTTGPAAVYSNDTAPQPGLISLSTTLLIVDIVTCAIQPLIALLGVVGNSLTLIVILYQGFQQTTNIILFGLAVTDLLYVLLSLRALVECMARRFDPQLAVDFDLFSQTTLTMLDTEIACLSRLYTCFIAVERFIVVRFPLQASRLLTKTRTIIISGFLWILASLSCIVCFLSLEVKEIYSPVDNTTSKVLDFTEFFKQNAEMVIFMSGLVFPMISRYIPIVIVFACTVIILQTLRHSRLQRKQMTSTAASGGSDQQQQQQITKALLAVCFVFLLTNIPGILLTFFRSIYAQDGFANVGKYQNIHKVAIYVLLVFMILNSSVNFMLYVIFNSKFAAASRKLMPRCWGSGTSLREV